MNRKWWNVATWIDKSWENFGSEDETEMVEARRKTDSETVLGWFGALLCLWRGRYVSMFRCWEASEYND